MMAAIWALVVASAAAVVAGFILDRTIAPLPVILGLVPTVTGTFSLLFSDADIIQWEASAKRWLFSTPHKIYCIQYPPLAGFIKAGRGGR
jgi:intracellular septation protein A